MSVDLANDQSRRPPAATASPFNANHVRASSGLCLLSYFPLCVCVCEGGWVTNCLLRTRLLRILLLPTLDGRCSLLPLPRVEVRTGDTQRKTRPSPLPSPSCLRRAFCSVRPSFCPNKRVVFFFLQTAVCVFASGFRIPHVLTHRLDDGRASRSRRRRRPPRDD